MPGRNSLSASTTSLAVTPGDRLLAGRIDLGHDHLVGPRQRPRTVRQRPVREYRWGWKHTTSPAGSVSRAAAITASTSVGWWA